MARQFQQATKDALAAGHVDFRNLAELVLDSGTYRFGNHTPGEWLTAAGQQWLGLGSLIKVPDLVSSRGLAADQVTITIDGTLIADAPESYGSASNWLREAFREDMVNRPFTLYEAYLHAQTGDVLEVVDLLAGPIDSAPLNLERMIGSIRIRSNRQALGWATGRSRSDADQQRIDPSDTSLRHVAELAASGGTLQWGYRDSAQGTNTHRGGGSSGGGRAGTDLSHY